MRRFGVALCAVLMLCQLLAFPVAADNLADEKAEYDETIVDEEVITTGPADDQAEDESADAEEGETEDESGVIEEESGVPETP